MGTSVVVLPGECCWGGGRYPLWLPGYLAWLPAGLLWENGEGGGCFAILGPDDALKGVSLRGVLILDGGLSSSRISNSCSSTPGTLSY